MAHLTKEQLAELIAKKSTLEFYNNTRGYHKSISEVKYLMVILI